MKRVNIICSLVAILFCTLLGGHGAYADAGIAVSPMYQKLILNPGDTYEGSFMVTNQQRNDSNIDFVAEVRPFYVDEDYNYTFDNKYNSYNQLAEWISVDNNRGHLSPNESLVVKYRINIPEDSPSGGQYAAIRVAIEKNSGSEEEGGINIKESVGIAYCLYVEVSGDTKKGGEIIEASVPSFLFSGNISGNSLIKNTGNVHGTASYILKVFPIFSDEEVYSNEENPETLTVLPDRALYNETSWQNTPGFGIFNVVYSVEFEGIGMEVSKMVIICPIWLMFLVIFSFVLLVFWIFTRIKRKKVKKT